MDDTRLSDLRESWRRHLTAGNKVPGTRRVYLAALDKLITHTEDAELIRLSNKRIEAFIGDSLERLAPATVSIDYRALQQFFKWAVAQDETNANPMLGMKPPIVPVQPPPVINEQDFARLITACAGKTLEDKRDLAIVRLFESSAIRLSELTSIRLDELWLNDRRAKVLGKGRRERLVRFDLEAANAIDRYLRARKRHRLANLPQLWIGDRGPLTPNGVYQVIRRRANKAGITLHPHLFRHTFAHEWMSAGGSESDLMTLAGWKSAQMVRRYGASAATERALAAYDRVPRRNPRTNPR